MVSFRLCAEDKAYVLELLHRRTIEYRLAGNRFAEEPCQPELLKAAVHKGLLMLLEEMPTAREQGVQAGLIRPDGLVGSVSDLNA